MGLRFISGEWILLGIRVFIVESFVSVDGIDVLGDLLSTDVKGYVDIDRFAVGVLRRGSIFSHYL